MKRLIFALIAMLGTVSEDSHAQFLGPDIPEHSTEVSAIYKDIETFMAHDPGDGSFLVFLLKARGPDGFSGNAQISFENGKLGVDHVLNSKVNVELMPRFRELAKKMGLFLIEREMNGMHYLRTESGNPQVIISRVLTEVFSLNNDDQVLVFGELEFSN